MINPLGLVMVVETAKLTVIDTSAFIAMYGCRNLGRKKRNE